MRTKKEIRALLKEAEKEWGNNWYSGYRYAMEVVLDPSKSYPLGITWKTTMLSDPEESDKKE